MTDKTPKPDPALQTLEPLVGRWDIKGRTPGATEDDITGAMTCDWMPGGFFLQQTGEMKSSGVISQSVEIIGYDPDSGKFPANCYSSMSGDVIAYQWAIDGDTLRHWTDKDEFTGKFVEGGRKIVGGWRPRSGKGFAYDAVMTRQA